MVRVFDNAFLSLFTCWQKASCTNLVLVRRNLFLCSGQKPFGPLPRNPRLVRLIWCNLQELKTVNLISYILGNPLNILNLIGVTGWPSWVKKSPGHQSCGFLFPQSGSSGGLDGSTFPLRLLSSRVSWSSEVRDLFFELKPRYHA